MIKILNQDRQLVAILENAYGIGYTKSLNQLWDAQFTLPLDDPKNELCTEFNFAEITDDTSDEYVGLFRIMPSLTMKNESKLEITYQLEHVLATLLDDILFGYHQTTNQTTRENIEYILNQQSIKHWRLGKCDFTRRFHYKYENENGLLGPLLAIPQPFDVDYQWTYDTTVYPWTLNLVAPSSEVTCEIRYGKNLMEIEREIDPYNIVNRIYPLGAGEGVNQLTIRPVNNGVNYLDNAESIAKYGVKKYVWVDRRFEDAQSLKDNAASLLKKWSVPKVVYKVKAADLSAITGMSQDKFVEGALLRIADPDVGIITQRIFKVSKADINGAPWDVGLEIGNLQDSIATTNADMSRKIQVNEAYTQGSTNILNYDYADNADSTHPAVISVYVPNDLVNINSLNLTYKLEKFRAYSQATEGGGATTRSTSSGGATTATSSSGGGTTATSSSGGGVSTTTQSGGGTTQTSSGGGDHRHTLFTDTGMTVPAPTSWRLFDVYTGIGTYSTMSLPADTPGSVATYSSSGNHTHSITLPAHSHSFSTPSHTHSVTIENHQHTVAIPNHVHDITLPNHTHELKFGIFELENVPSRVTIRVDDNVVPVTSASGNEIDLIPYLAKDSSGKVRRGEWHTVSIQPNGLARVTASVVSRLFVSSHIGGNY